ncbi:MAG TPA: YggT family protein [Candidatus Binataceae bacterium]|nr:YggT family protein [Candidatus Binataceae bacterium]
MYPDTIAFIVGILERLLWAYTWIVIIAALLTWIEPNPYNPIVRFLYSITEPVFGWVREHLPVFFGGIDFSPLIVLIVIEFVQQVILPHLAMALISVNS